MILLLSLGFVGLAILLTPVLQRVLQRNAGWPLAALYLAAAGALAPAAAETLRGETVSVSFLWVPSLGISMNMTLDALGMIFAYIALVIGAVVLIYSTRYLGPDRQLSYFLVMTVFTFAMMGLVFAADLILLFICWELTSIASFLLIARSGQPGEAASMRTLFLTFVGGLFLLTAVVLVWAKLGTTNMQEIFASGIWSADPTFTSLVAILVLLAAFTKSAQFPFHVWLPDAMAAITPVSAYLHAAAVVKAGIFLLLRFSPLFHETPVWNIALITAGLATSLIGGWFAMQQTDLKKLMAYSTVSQLGLLVATIGIGTEAAIAAAILHTIANALFKSGLFMMVGVVDHATHTRDLRRLPPKLYRKMPVSFAITVLGCASMAGVPPMLGFLSKESVLAAMIQAPGPNWTGWVALAVAGFGGILTLSYCLKIVFGAFIDGREESREVKGQDAVIVGSAGLPILASVPLVAVPFVFDIPVGQATNASLGSMDASPRFYLWHGITAELIVTAVILAVGVLIAFRRVQLFKRVEAKPFPFTGADVIMGFREFLTEIGSIIHRVVAFDHATRHVLAIFLSLAGLGIFGTIVVARAGDLPPITQGVSQPIDAVLLVLICGSAVCVCIARSRLAATVALSAVGVLATAQILVLGAPDVALTQLLVEMLTVIVIMLVLQKLPRQFSTRKGRGSVRTVLVSVLVGAGVAGLSWVLHSRRGKSELADYYLANTYDVSGGYNVVNIILVEFRAMDTLGELSVLGMAGVAIIAVFSTVRHRHLDPATQAELDLDLSKIALRADPKSTAHRAILVSWPNVVPLKLMLRVIVPTLVFLSSLLFLRGHDQPGGGFNAALVASAIVGLIYLSTSKDRQIGPLRLPLYLIGGGIMIAVLTGLIGLISLDSFLQPLHGYVGSLHVSTSMLFDIGVYTAVLGLVMVSFNLLGTSIVSAENTRERVDQSLEGELPGPLDTVRGERVARDSTLVADGRPPREPGR